MLVLPVLSENTTQERCRGCQATANERDMLGKYCKQCHLEGEMTALVPCYRCGEFTRPDDREYHHTSYIPETLVPVCHACHTRIHQNPLGRVDDEILPDLGRDAAMRAKKQAADAASWENFKND